MLKIKLKVSFTKSKTGSDTYSQCDVFSQLMSDIIFIMRIFQDNLTSVKLLLIITNLIFNSIQFQFNSAFHQPPYSFVCRL